MVNLLQLLQPGPAAQPGQEVQMPAAVPAGFGVLVQNASGLGQASATLAANAAQIALITAPGGQSGGGGKTPPQAGVVELPLLGEAAQGQTGSALADQTPAAPEAHWLPVQTISAAQLAPFAQPALTAPPAQGTQSDEPALPQASEASAAPAVVTPVAAPPALDPALLATATSLRQGVPATPVQGPPKAVLAMAHPQAAAPALPVQNAVQNPRVAAPETPAATSQAADVKQQIPAAQLGAPAAATPAAPQAQQAQRPKAAVIPASTAPLIPSQTPPTSAAPAQPAQPSQGVPAPMPLPKAEPIAAQPAQAPTASAAAPQPLQGAPVPAAAPAQPQIAAAAPAAAAAVVVQPAVPARPAPLGQTAAQPAAPATPQPAAAQVVPIRLDPAPMTASAQPTGQNGPLQPTAPQAQPGRAEAPTPMTPAQPGAGQIPASPAQPKADVPAAQVQATPAPTTPQQTPLSLLQAVASQVQPPARGQEPAAAPQSPAARARVNATAPGPDAPAPTGAEKTDTRGQAAQVLPLSASAAKPETMAQGQTATGSPIIGQPVEMTPEPGTSQRGEAPLLPSNASDTARQAVASAAAQSDPSAKPAPKPFSEALMAQVRAVEVSDGRTTVNLHPRGLGAIEIEILSDKDGGSKVIVRVENPTVLQHLREDRDLLAQTIGVEDSSVFDFRDQDAKGDTDDGQQGGQAATGIAQMTANSPDPVTGHVDVLGAGQLDILT